jgi:hypothetical protein
MSRRLYASGSFKRITGEWLPETDRFLYTANDTIFAKIIEGNSWEQVGGGEPGAAAEESARILFWYGGCRICDINLVTVDARTGMANTGKLVLTMTRDEDFKDGWFVAVESFVSQVTIPLLTTLDDGRWRPSYTDSRSYTRRFDADPIEEDDEFICWPFPSMNIIAVPGDNAQEYRFANYNLLNYLANFSTFFFTGGGAGAAERRLSPASDPQQLTARIHKVSCGTVADGNRTTLSTQGVWTGIVTRDDTYIPSAEMWLGIGDNFVRAGMGRSIFLPPMNLTDTQRDRLQSPNRYWKVDAIPGDFFTVRDQFGSSRSRRTSGISAFGARGELVLGTRVTESPKSRNKRSSLVTSPQGLIWSRGVIPGINADHTRKACIAPETAFPFDQPQQSRAFSIGADKANPSSLTATFSTTATKLEINFREGTVPTRSPIPMTSDLLKPRARVFQTIRPDESGRIGRLFPGYDRDFNVLDPIDFTDAPTKEPWAGVFESDLEVMRTEGQVISDRGFFNGVSDQTQLWETSKAYDYRFEIESLRDVAYVSLKGSYVGKNILPDGTPSSLDLFYAEPVLDETSSIPTLLEPRVLTPGTIDRLKGWEGTGFIDSVFYFSRGIPFIYAKRKFIGSHTILIGGTSYDPSYRNTEYDNDSFDSYFGQTLFNVAGWTRVDESHANTATKLTMRMIWSAVRSLTQAYPNSVAPDDATPGDEFYKADPAQFDDYMEKLCAAATVSVVKSCRWIPKQTQMFMAIERETRRFGSGIPGGWGYYGGTVPEEDRLEMLDQYEPIRRTQVDPGGGSITVFLRRTWQIELVIASGSPAYKPMEVISDDLQRVVTYADGRFGGRNGLIVNYNGTRKAQCGIEFDLDTADTVTHLMNHQQTFSQAFSFTELEWERLEAGEAIEKDVIGVDRTRSVENIDPRISTDIETDTKIVFQFS